MEAYRNPALSPRERALDLLSRMTLRERIGQLTQRLYGFSIYERRGDTVTLTEEFQKEVAKYSGVGAIYGLYRADPWSGRTFETGLTGSLAPKVRNQVQRYIIEHSRLGIPALMTSECPHGHQALDGYLLPVNLASAASFAPELLERAAGVAGKQLQAMGVDLALVSMLDMLRDPRWGRSEECFGEDPYLASRFARAACRGIQAQGVDVTAKHMCAQGETTGGVNASAARIGERELREIHLPGVKACVEEGVASFMAAYNEIDGIYCHGNPHLLRDILRKEYGFKGLVMADGCAIDQLDAVTGDRVSAGALALDSGVDLGLWDEAFGHLEEALARGLVDVGRVDEACLRVLELKFRRGLFEHPYVPENDHWMAFNPENYPQVGRLSRESMVLLKNEGGILPLQKNTSLFLTGPNADAIYNQLGDYTPPVRSGITVRAGLEQAAPGCVTYAPGCNSFGSSVCIPETAADCQAAVAVLGGTSSRFTGAEFLENGALKAQEQVTMDCGENVDSASLRLPGKQLALLRQLRSRFSKVITVLIGGRPYEMGEISALSDAIFCCFYPGPTGGRELAALLYGEEDPSGRLPVSLPDFAAQLPVYYNYKDSYRAMTYYDSKERPQYGFGSGLSYTSFAYAAQSCPEGEDPSLVLTLCNTGSRRGAAVPQLYLHRTEGIATSRIRQLAAFQKVWLDPGETRTIRLSPDPDALCQWNSQMEQVKVPGKIQWFLCDSGKTLLEGEFRV